MIKVNKDWLTRQTGDPFVDTGGWVIQWCWEQPYLKDKTILELIEWVSKVYVFNNWKLDTFFLNHPITYSSKSKSQSEVRKQRFDKTIAMYKALANETEKGVIGTCRILGEKTTVFAAGRSNSILSGSGAFINFHHAFDSGLMVSKEVLIRLFFVPYGTQIVNGLNAALTSNSSKVQKLYTDAICNENEQRITEGLLKSKFRNQATALFDFAASCHDRIDDDEIVEMNLFHYSNYATKAEVNLYSFSAILFEFYRKVKTLKYKEEWKYFIRSFFYQDDNDYRDEKKLSTFLKRNLSNYDEKDENFTIKVKKKPPILVPLEDIQKWRNSIYERLINGQSIIPEFQTWSRFQYFSKKEIHIFHIAKLYQKYFSNMNDKALEKIEFIANYIVGDKGKAKKRLGKLRNTRNENDVREFLLDLIKDRFEEKNSTPLLKLTDYTNLLFPEGTYGTTIRDLLLIAVYEKLSIQGTFFESEKESIVQN